MTLPRFPVRWLPLIGLALWAGTTAGAQEVMAVNQVIVFSKDSTLVSVDAAGTESRSENTAEGSANHPATVSQAGPGGKIEVSGGTAAEMIISEAVTARLEPGTQIEVPKIEEGQKPTASLRLLKGKMFIKVDAEKLKKDGNVEFRLKTPKSLLAVRGTKFVTTAADQANTVALLEGEVAVRDLATKEFVILRPGQATDVTGEGKLVARRFMEAESAYRDVFAQGELVFVPYRIDQETIRTSYVILPPGADRNDDSAWISRPDDLFKATSVKFDGFPYKGVRGQCVPDGPYEELFLDLQFKPFRLKVAPEKIIGVFVTARTSGPFRPLVSFNLPCTDSRRQETMMRIDSDNPDAWNGEWRTYFGPARPVGDSYSPEQLELLKDSEGVKVDIKLASWLNKEPAPRLSIEIASIQVVTLGGDEK